MIGVKVRRCAEEEYPLGDRDRLSRKIELDDLENVPLRLGQELPQQRLTTQAVTCTRLQGLVKFIMQERTPS